MVPLQPLNFWSPVGCRGAGAQRSAEVQGDWGKRRVRHCRCLTDTQLGRKHGIYWCLLRGSGGFNQQLGTTGVAGITEKPLFLLLHVTWISGLGPVSSQISSKHHTKRPGSKSLWQATMVTWYWKCGPQTKQNFSRCAAQSITHVTKWQPSSKHSKTHRAENVLMLDLHSDGSLPRRTRLTNFMTRSFCALKRGWPPFLPFPKVMVTRFIQKISGGLKLDRLDLNVICFRLFPSRRSYWMKMRRKAKHLGSCWLWIPGIKRNFKTLSELNVNA